MCADEFQTRVANWLLGISVVLLSAKIGVFESGKSGTGKIDRFLFLSERSRLLESILNLLFLNYFSTSEKSFILI